MLSPLCIWWFNCRCCRSSEHPRPFLVWHCKLCASAVTARFVQVSHLPLCQDSLPHLRVCSCFLASLLSSPTRLLASPASHYQLGLFCIAVPACSFSSKTYGQCEQRKEPFLILFNVCTALTCSQFGSDVQKQWGGEMTELTLIAVGGRGVISVWGTERVKSRLWGFTEELSP